MLEGYEAMYERLITTMAQQLLPEILRSVVLEIIFMTYGTATRTINEQAFPGAVRLFEPDRMSYCGRNRYGYNPKEKEHASEFLKNCIGRHIPDAKIAYIV